MSVFTRMGTPSSVSAISPIRTMSPAPLEPHPEEPSAHQSPHQAAIPLPPSPRGTPEPELQPSRTSTPSVPSISKPPTPSPESPVSTFSYTRTRVGATAPAPPPLQPPPPVDFNPEPVTWKSLTLDAAQWTFSSEELQAIVSRAIRASAEPSSIRLLPIQMLDGELVQEVERLESERAKATAEYRFMMHRRTMLLQSLNATSGPSSSPTSFTGNMVNLSQSSAVLSPAADLAQRLADVSASLDRLATTVCRVSDQLAQIRSLQEVHAASALAVALRKLNASYARRVRENQSLKEKLAAAEDERDEAWRVAEELAVEYDEEIEDVTEGDVVNGERAVAVPATFTRASRVGMRIKVPGVGPRIQPSDPEDIVPEATGEVPTSDSPNSAPGETPSTPVHRRRRANSATSRVSAARTRSVRASKASLRFPRNQGSRPPSSYSQHSTQSGTRARSRSRAGSRPGSPVDAPSTSGVNTPDGAIPDVPKIPNADELKRLASVKSTSSTPTTLPPLPPPPIETNVAASSSFLDMTTRPNSASDEKGKSPEKASTDNGDAGLESNVQEHTTLSPGDAQANSAALTDVQQADGDGLHDGSDLLQAKSDEEADEAQIISIPPRPPPKEPISASRVEASKAILPEAIDTKKQLQARPSLQVYPPTWTRPPPDSPVDVTRGSNPHRADGEDDDFEEDAEEAELADEFEMAYAQTARGAVGYMRSPLRVQHAQSMLPFPGTEGRGPFLNGTVSGREALKRSPLSENDVQRPFQGAEVSASSRRPTSLPSAQGEKPWNYF